MRIYELDNSINDAIQCIGYAIYVAEAIANQHDNQWRDINALCDRLKGIERNLVNIITPEIQEAIQGERDENDRLADMADAISY